MSKAAETRKANAAKRAAKEAEKKELLTVMQECLVELIQENELSPQAKLTAVTMLDEVRKEHRIV